MVFKSSLYITVIFLIDIVSSQNLKGVNWTWIGGSSKTAAVTDYGTLGFENELNIPGARFDHAIVVNPNDGMIYLFGGKDFKGINSVSLSVMAD